MRRTAIVTSVVIALTLGATSVAAPSGVVWRDYLAGLDGHAGSGPHPVPGCRQPSLQCVGVEIRRLRALRHALGCDHRAVFATTYLELTRTLFSTVTGNRTLFLDPRYLFYEDALFADVYFTTVHRYERGLPVPGAWRIAFDSARSGAINAGQDMLLGINAHVQNDMPYVLASLGLRTPAGASRKPDHDVVNRVLAKAYQRVVSSIARRYDPLVSTTNSSATPFDDAAGLELVRRWREDVWHNAERLVAARTPAERRQVSDGIQANATSWAQQIAAPQTPGYRASRDSYCRSHNR